MTEEPNAGPYSRHVLKYVLPQEEEKKMVIDRRNVDTISEYIEMYVLFNFVLSRRENWSHLKRHAEDVTNG